MSGKGSRPRPYSVTQDEYDNRWDAIFGKDKKTVQESDSEQGEPQSESENQPTLN